MVYTAKTPDTKEIFEDEELMEEMGPLKVLGKKVDAVGTVTYEGCYVWKTKEKARKHTSDFWEVFGVDADWHGDVIHLDDKSYGRLKNDATLVNLQN